MSHFELNEWMVLIVQNSMIPLVKTSLLISYGVYYLIGSMKTYKTF